ncbi:MAG: IS1595 family transposase [Chloroflexi bacterium]|nr:IS1595 family transposase [Chloroflexota bacterium]
MSKKKTKSPMQKYTIKDFQEDFATDDVCLEWLRNTRYPELIECEGCKREAKYYRIKERKVYGCEWCGHQISPTAGTIFHKSRTPLTLWFYVIYLMAQTRGGISAKQIERETGVTYKTAWRMCKQIRSMLSEDQDPFSGKTELDESYFGGRRRGKRGRGAEGKTAVVGMANRTQGKVEVVAVPNTQTKTLMPIIENEVVKGTQIYTDEYPVYNRLPYLGYKHDKVLHSHDIYVMGNVHTNTIEDFWSLVKNGIRGVYHSVSPEYLQTYLNEYAFRYNHRNDIRPMFLTFLSRWFRWPRNPAEYL